MTFRFLRLCDTFHTGRNIFIFQMKMIRTLRKYSTVKKNFYVTTPIYYVNAAPHIGHLYSSVIADAIQKFHKLIEPEQNVFLATGTDEHGSKIQRAALEMNKPLTEYCSSISSSYRDMFDSFDVNYGGFIRTTDEKHRKAVHKFWEILDKNGHIYSSKYAGWYCVSDETFLTDIELTERILPDGRRIKVSAESGHPVEWTEEQNYMFKLSNFQDDLKNWLLKNENVVKPKKFYDILLNWVKNTDFGDVSISRPATRVHWGIPIPSDDSQTIYVWMDALVNYLSIIGYPDENYKGFWPADVQVIGKDILKFHGIYWPAFLMGAGLELPKTILCHSHWTVDGEKMSKSKSNVISPLEIKDVYTGDGIRYFLLREGVAHSDGNYSTTKLIRILNSELADTFGNLLSRCCAKTLNPHQNIPKITKDALDFISELDVGKRLIESLQALEETCRKHYENYNFYKAVDAVTATLHIANLFIETMKPWELKKTPELQSQLDVTLFMALETLRICGIILQPIVPGTCKKLLDKLNVPEENRYWKDAKVCLWKNEAFGSVDLAKEQVTLFKRIILETDKKRKRKTN